MQFNDLDRFGFVSQHLFGMKT